MMMKTLRIAFLSGIILLVVIGGILAVIYGSGSFSRSARRAERESEFSRLLREYDFKRDRILENESLTVRRQEFEILEGELDRLEKQAGWVESWLSVLKRRRELAAYAQEWGDSRYTQSYRESARRAAGAFPYSEQIAAVAAAAFVYNAAITRDGEGELRKMLPLLASPNLFPMRLSLHVLLGDFRSPESADPGLLADVYRSPDLVVSGFRQSGVSLADREAVAIIADLLILKILAQDIPSVTMDIQAAILAFPSPELTRLAAEYLYDFGDLLRSAELFSLLPDEAALSRQADALWLAGYTDSARTLWTMLTAEQPAQGNTLLCRALYNLALTSAIQREAVALYQRLIAQNSAIKEPSRQYGIIRLSRMYDAPQAQALLDTQKGSDVLIDLEILKRRTEIAEPARIVAETWLLLDEYPAAEEVYQWGFWYFNLQRNYAENVVLLRAAERHDFTGWWMELYEALRIIREGDPDAAQKILAAVSEGHWTTAANFGRLLEAANDPARALESYERAMAALIGTGQPDSAAWRSTASRIQVRIALCLRSLGRIDESRRALEYALDLNRDNVNARLELNRVE